MRIAVFIKGTTFHKNYGGLETQNKVLCEGLTARGHEVWVFAPQKEVSSREETLNGVKYIFIPASYRYLLASLNSTSWERKSVEIFAQNHKERPFDIAISQSTGGIGLIKSKEKYKIKVISIAHGTTGGELITHFQNIRSLKDLYWGIRNLQYSLRQYFGRQRDFVLRSNKVVAVSDFVRNRLKDETFAPDELFEVIHNGMDPKIFEVGKEDKIDSRKVQLIFTGRVVRSKGVFELINILKELKSEELVLNIVGDGEDMDELRKLISADGLEDKVVLHGKVSHDEVINKLLNSDIFVFPTLRMEGFPMNLVEAMFASLPIVAYSMGGVSDAVNNGVTGFLIEPKDSVAFVKTLKELIKDSELRTSMGTRAKVTALENFSTSVMLEKYEKLVSSVLSAGKDKS
jgi:glycosyltransferase involved in cell wall biosynthesis